MERHLVGAFRCFILSEERFPASHSLYGLPILSRSRRRLGFDPLQSFLISCQPVHRSYSVCRFPLEPQIVSKQPAILLKFFPDRVLSVASYLDLFESDRAAGFVAWCSVTRTQTHFAFMCLEAIQGSAFCS